MAYGNKYIPPKGNGVEVTETLPTTPKDNQVVIDKSSGTPIVKVYNEELGIWESTAGGASGDLGYTPINKAGDTVTGNLILQDGVSIIPQNPDGATLGSPDKPFADAYIGANSLYVDGNKVISSTETTLDITTTPDQHLTVSTAGLGTTRLASAKEVLLYSGDDLNLQASGDMTALSKGRVCFKTDADGQDILFETQGTLSNINFKSKKSTNFASPDISFSSKPKVNGLNVIVEGDSISANNIGTTSDKQFISTTKLSEIDSNTSEIGSHATRIQQLETDIQNVSGTDEKVKMSGSDSTSGYLSDYIDNTTIQNNGGKLTVEGINGVIASKDELNFLQGVTSNIQQQINNLSGVSAFRGVFASLSDLQALTDADEGDYAIVTSGTDSSYYFYYGDKWDFSHKASGSSIIDINSGTTGTLSKNRYEKQNASETPFVDSSGKITANNIQDAVLQVFQKSESMKTSIANTLGSPLLPSDTTEQMETKIQQLKVALANAITDKGVVTYSSNTIDEMVGKILAISNISIAGTVKSTSKINVTAPYSHQIILSQPLKIEDIATTVLQYVGNDSNIVQYNADYNNAEANSFNYNPNEIQFDGFMNIKDSFDFALTEVEDDVYYESDEIDFTQFVDFGGDVGLNVDGLNVNIKGIKTISSVVVAKNDISIAGVESLDKINWTTVLSGNGISKLVVSFDSGVTFKAWNGSEWITVNINDKNDMRTNGMSKNVVDLLTDMELKVARDNSNFIRFAYYLERPMYEDVAKNDKIELRVTMLGRNELAPTNKYNYTYDPSTKTLTYNFTQSGTYTINYVESV